MSVSISNGIFDPMRSSITFELQLPIAPTHDCHTQHFPQIPSIPPIDKPSGIQGVQGIQGIRGFHGHMGLRGEKGDPGHGLNIVGRANSISELPQSENIGVSYLVGTQVYIYLGVGNGDLGTPVQGWVNLGSLVQGPQGPAGAIGGINNVLGQRLPGYVIAVNAEGNLEYIDPKTLI